ncbi:MAG: hypothetical protein Q9169_004816 [Polycauliona sp. 2 TL-2023]
MRHVRKLQESPFYKREEIINCTHRDCPMFPLRHLQGHYVHNDVRATAHLATFGTSNPPPSIWQAVYNGCHGKGTQHDADLISRFLEYHVVACNFSVVPDGNFIWGQEVRAGEFKRRPWVRMPGSMTVPLRVRFDAGLNLPDVGGEVDGDELEQEQDQRRKWVWRGIRGVPTTQG